MLPSSTRRFLEAPPLATVAPAPADAPKAGRFVCPRVDDTVDEDAVVDGVALTAEAALAVATPVEVAVDAVGATPTGVAVAADFAVAVGLVDAAAADDDEDAAAGAADPPFIFCWASMEITASIQ